MIGSLRVLLIVTSHFPMYQSTFWLKKHNDKKKLTGRPSPTVPWGMGSTSQEMYRKTDFYEVKLRQIFINFHIFVKTF